MYRLGLFLLFTCIQIEMGLFLLFTCKQIKMLLHHLSWISILVQSFISISYLFEIFLSKLNNNNDNEKNFEN